MICFRVSSLSRAIFILVAMRLQATPIRWTRLSSQRSSLYSNLFCRSLWTEIRTRSKRPGSYQSSGKSSSSTGNWICPRTPSCKHGKARKPLWRRSRKAIKLWSETMNSGTLTAVKVSGYSPIREVIRGRVGRMQTTARHAKTGD